MLQHKIKIIIDICKKWNNYNGVKYYTIFNGALKIAYGPITKT